MAYWRPIVVVLTALAALTGCGDDRSATAAGTLYHCGSQGDCVAGYVCTCNLCQAPGKQVGCDASQDTGVDTVGGTDAVELMDAIDAVQPADTADAGPISCNLVDWTPCPAGQGCFCPGGQCNDKGKTGGGWCGAHGNLTLDAKCDPSSTDCGVGDLNGKSRNLLCDTIDKKCYPTCNCLQQGLYPCRATEKCWCLQDPKQKDWPGGAGICAPK